MAKTKPTIRLRTPIKENPIITGGDGGYSVRSPIDPDEMRVAMGRLFDDFAIKHGDWETLAQKLALKGGFINIERATGKVPHWNKNLRCALWLAVDLWSHEHGQSVDAALKSDEFQQRWAELSRQPDKGGTLSTRYYETKKGADPLVWLLAWVRVAAPEQFWERAPGLLQALLSEARLERGREVMRRRLSTDITG